MARSSVAHSDPDASWLEPPREASRAVVGDRAPLERPRTAGGSIAVSQLVLTQNGVQRASGGRRDRSTGSVASRRRPSVLVERGLRMGGLGDAGAIAQAATVGAD